MSDLDVTVAPDDYTAKLMAEVERLQGENASHRERITTQKQTIQAYRDESREWREVAERAQAENEQLRELARGLYYCHDERKCDHCSLQYDDGMPDVINGPKCLRMMDDLGIEVD